MGVFFVYILKSSVCLALFYLFYRLLLSRDTFHRFNRIALLGVIILSALIPFYQIVTEQPEVFEQSISDSVYIRQIILEKTEISSPTEWITWIRVSFILYICGVLYFSTKLVYSTICIYRLIRSGQVELLENGKRSLLHLKQSVLLVG